MVMNKKGILRIIEAVIAVVLVIGVLVVVNLDKPRQDNDLTVEIPSILDEIAKDNNMRRNILSYKFGSDSYTLTSEDKAHNDEVVGNLKEFVEQRAVGVKSDVRICGVLDICPLIQYPAEAEEIFAAERIISADIGSGFNPRKVKIFLWRR